MYFIIHETSATALVNILKTNTLFKSSKLQEMGLKNGQGRSQNIIVKDPKLTLTDPNFVESGIDEVDGVYFRLVTDNIKPVINYGDCILVFPFDVVVENHNNFVFNSEDNKGFCIAEDGVVAETQFSGDEGITISKLENFHILEHFNFNHYSSEIVIMDDVNLTKLNSIFIKRNKLNGEIISLCQQKNINVNILD